MHISYAKLSVTAAVFLAMVGCDGRPKVVPVSGQVVINGEPLKVKGFVRVEPADGRAAIGAIDPSDGTFTLTTFEKDDGCITGTHPVAVIANVMVGGTELVSLIPEEYSDTSTSGLEVTIDEPTDSLKIELSGKLKPAPEVGPDAYKGDDPG